MKVMVFTNEAGTSLGYKEVKFDFKYGTKVRNADSGIIYVCMGIADIEGDKSDIVNWLELCKETALRAAEGIKEQAKMLLSLASRYDENMERTLSEWRVQSAQAALIKSIGKMVKLI